MCLGPAFDLRNETVPRLNSVINPLLEVLVMNIRPLHDRVVVKRLEEDTEKTSGGLFIPESAKEKPQRGEVFAVGKGKREEGKVVPLDVQKGDQILFGKYSGSEVKLDGIEYLIMREDEILVVLDK